MRSCSGVPGSKPLERIVPGCARLGVVPLPAVERAEVREHAAGTVAVAELGQEDDRRLVGVECAGLVADPRLGEPEPVQGQRRAVRSPSVRKIASACSLSSSASPSRSSDRSTAARSFSRIASPAVGGRRGRASRAELAPQLLPA